MSYRIKDSDKYRIKSSDSYRIERQTEAETVPRPSDPEPIQRAACRAIGLPHPADLKSGMVSGLHHRLGTFRIAHSQAATVAAVTVFRRLHFDQFYTLAEYMNAVKRSDVLRNQLKPEPRNLEELIAYKPSNLTDNDKAFIHRYTIDRYTSDLPGYLRYILDQVPGLHELLQRDIEMHAPEAPRTTHTYMLGTTGSGKSELLKILIHSYVCAPKSAAVVVIEPSGDFVGQVARWPEFIGTDRLVYLKVDLASGMVPTINPFEYSDLDPLDTSRAALEHKQTTAQELQSALEAILAVRAGGDMTINMSALVYSCLLVLLEKPGATLLDLQRFMDKDRNADLVEFGASRTHFPQTAELFASRFNGPSFDLTRGAINTKLQTIFDKTAFIELTCGRSTVDLTRAINARKIILFSLSDKQLGPDGSPAFGRLMIAMIQAIAKRREDIPKPMRVPTHLIVDECHNFLTPAVEKILLESRKYALYLTLCQQSVGNEMTPKMKKIVTGMTNVKITGKVQSDHYESVGQQVLLTSSDIRQLANHPDTERWFYINVGGGETFRFASRSDLIDTSHQTTPEMWKVTKAKQIRAYYRSVDEREGGEAAPEPDGATSPIKRSKRKLN